MQLYFDVVEFEWDKGNRDKNKTSHNVEWWECEEVFFNFPLFIISDDKHSQKENRFYVFGKTNSKRLLTIVFTLRQKKIRIISARDMNKKERIMYNEKTTSLQN